MTDFEQVMMNRDHMTKAEARAEKNRIRNELLEMIESGASYDEVEEMMMCEAGLEMDYIEELI